MSIGPDDEDLKVQIYFNEGKSHYPYVDTVGKITVGAGRNLTDNGLSEEEIDFLYNNDMNRVFDELNEHLPWWGELNDVRQRVIADMCFNLGITKLLEFKATLKLVQERKFDEAAAQMLRSKWARQVKGRAVRLAGMMKEG